MYILYRVSTSSSDGMHDLFSFYLSDLQRTLKVISSSHHGTLCSKAHDISDFEMKTLFLIKKLRYSVELWHLCALYQFIDNMHPNLEPIQSTQTIRPLPFMHANNQDISILSPPPTAFLSPVPPD